MRTAYGHRGQGTRQGSVPSTWDSWYVGAFGGSTSAMVAWMEHGLIVDLGIALR